MPTKKKSAKTPADAHVEKQPTVGALSRMTRDETVAVQLASLEQFIRQVHAVEKRSEKDAVKASIYQGLALNYAKPLLSGGFTEWARDRFPDISQTQQHYYRKVAADFQTVMKDRLRLPAFRARDGASVVLRSLGDAGEADGLVGEYIGDRSITDILYAVGARPKARRGGFTADVLHAAAFIEEVRPDLSGVPTAEWDAATILQFGQWCKTRADPSADTRLAYEAAKASFDHVLGKLTDLVTGDRPKHQLLSGKECSEVAAHLRACADRVAACADRDKKPRKPAKKTLKI